MFLHSLAIFISVPNKLEADCLMFYSYGQKKKSNFLESYDFFFFFLSDLLVKATLICHLDNLVICDVL